MLLTYGLLIGALALDFPSIRSLFKHSDWFAISHFQKSNETKVIERQKRYFNEVSQLNFITYHVKDMPVWLNKLADNLHLRSLLKDIKESAVNPLTFWIKNTTDSDTLSIMI
ncbi:hypothetical protein SLA2020_088550 [Shorea laevis]